VAVVLLSSTYAAAQTARPRSISDYEVGYVEGIVQSAFGNVTSQSFGGEVGFAVRPALQVFVEAGKIRDTAPSSLGPTAQIIAGYLTQTQSGAVSYSVEQPATFALGGIRYVIPYDDEIQPYVVGGAGVAHYTRAVGFSVGGTDVTDTIGQYGVALGTDLSGSSNKAMVTVGGGVVWNVASPLFVDLQYRYGRIFASGGGINVSRGGIGVGVRF
jgi:opacity protein-like surface antigen